MKRKKINYLALILIHIFIGLAIFALPFLSKIYNISIFVLGLIFIIKNENKNNEVLIASGYLVVTEVVLRMTDGNILSEFVKYAVMAFMIIGIMYSGFSRNAVPIWIYFLLLIPGVILSTFTVNLETDLRKAIIFNIIGPVCLTVCAIYCYQRYVTQKQIDSILLAMALPIVTTLTYMFLYTPSVRDVVTNTQSNFATSGGYGPNQVSTILGLGIFLFFVRVIFYSKNNFLLIINGLLLCFVTFRGIVTFSRGGVIAGGIMILLLLGKLLLIGNKKGRSKLLVVSGLAVVILIGIWTYSSLQTGGLIEKRYANQDARGREKSSKLSGREALIESEIQMFLENPILGVGVGKNREYRQELTGIDAASHNEISRMLAEHGTFGILAFLILLLTPVLLSFNNRQYFYLFPFLIFWLLTINHAAMRIAAPAFVYALSLLKIESFEKPTLHRK